MRYLLHQKFKFCSLSEWQAVYNSKASVRAEFSTGEVHGVVNENEVMTYFELTNIDAASAHTNEAEITAHIERIGETTEMYELHEVSSDSAGNVWFGHFTFENESPEEWIATWKNDPHRLSTNETFAIVDANNVLVLMESHASLEDHEKHVNRPEVKAHIDKVKEKSVAWLAIAAK